MQNQMINLVLTREEAEHVYQALIATKRVHTENGRIWEKHTMNAHIRTMIEGEYARVTS